MKAKLGATVLCVASVFSAHFANRAPVDSEGWAQKATRWGMAGVNTFAGTFQTLKNANVDAKITSKEVDKRCKHAVAKLIIAKKISMDAILAEKDAYAKLKDAVVMYRNAASKLGDLSERAQGILTDSTVLQRGYSMRASNLEGLATGLVFAMPEVEMSEAEEKAMRLLSSLGCNMHSDAKPKKVNAKRASIAKLANDEKQPASYQAAVAKKCSLKAVGADRKVRKMMKVTKGKYVKAANMLTAALNALKTPLPEGVVPPPDTVDLYRWRAEVIGEAIGSYKGMIPPTPSKLQTFKKTSGISCS